MDGLSQFGLESLLLTAISDNLRFVKPQELRFRQLVLY